MSMKEKKNKQKKPRDKYLKLAWEIIKMIIRLLIFFN